MKLDIETANELRAGAFELYNEREYESDEERRKFAEQTAGFLNLIDRVMVKAQEAEAAEVNQWKKFREIVERASYQAGDFKHELES